MSNLPNNVPKIFDDLLTSLRYNNHKQALEKVRLQGSKMPLNQFVELILIDDYADKDLINGYHLDISDINKTDFSIFLDLLIEHDEAFQEIVKDYMTEVIEEHLVQRELHDRMDKGLTLKHHKDGDGYLVVEKR